MTARKSAGMIENKRSLARYNDADVAMDQHRGGLHGQAHVQQQLTAADIWRTLVKRKFTILGFTAVVLALSAVYAYTRVPLYEGVARLQIDPSRSTDLGLDDGTKVPGSSTDVDGHVKTEVAIIQSETVATRVMNALRLFSNPHFAGPLAVGTEVTDMAELTPSQRQKMLALFYGSLNVKVVPSTEIVEVRFRSPDPALATEAANSVVDEYMKRNFLARVNGTAQVSVWMSKQLEEIRNNTDESQHKLADFQRYNNLLGTDESDNIVTNRLKQLNEELTQAEADRIVKEGRYRLANSGNPSLIDSMSSSATLQALQSRRADLQIQYSQLGAKFGSGYPKLRELKSQLEQLDGEIQKEGANIETRLANEYQASAKTEDMIRHDFEKQKGQAYKLNENVAQYDILKHEVEAGQQLYDTLQLKLKAAGITSGLASSFVSVIDRASLPDLPVEPRKSFYLALGLGGGLFGGLLLALIRDSLDDTITKSEELEALSALPELGLVPFLPVLVTKEPATLTQSRALLTGSATFNPLVLREPNCPGVEAYRALCSVILQSAAKTLVITSATPGEGKSTVSCNVATVLAQRGRRVLLVDADMRCSSFRSPLGVKPGLSALCAGSTPEYPRYQPVQDLPGLHVVPSGVRPNDPTALLDSNRMQQLMTSWRGEYDHIIIDTPPVLPFADALVLATKADGVILVARSGISREKALLRARDVLSRTGANILGFVLNAVRELEYYYEYPAGYELPAKVDTQARH